jgi:hypothetical protein
LVNEINRGLSPVFLFFRYGRLVWAAGIGLEADLLAAPGEAGMLPRVAG